MKTAARREEVCSEREREKERERGREGRERESQSKGAMAAAYHDARLRAIGVARNAR